MPKKTYKKPAVKSVKKTKTKATKTKLPVVKLKPGTVVQLSVPAPLNEQSITSMNEVRKASELVAQTALVNITTQDDAINAGRILQELKVHQKDIKAKRDFMVKPLKEHVARLEALFRPIQERLEGAEASLKAKVLVFTTKQREEAKQREQKLLAEALNAQEDGDNETALALATEATSQDVMAKTTHFEGGGFLQVKEVDAFEVTDLGAVPHEFFSLDESKVRAAIKVGQRDIPGIRVYKKQQAAVSTGT